MQEVNSAAPAVVGGGFAMLDEIDLTNVDTNRPVIKEPTIRVRWEKAEVVDSKDRQSKNMNVTLVTVGTTTDAKTGKPINPGHKLITTISLKKTDAYDFTQRLAEVQLCFLGRKGKWSTAEMVGKEGDIRQEIENFEGVDRNKVARYLEKKQAQPAVALA